MEFIEQEIGLSLTPYARASAPNKVMARTCGALAYHPSLTYPDRWSITHIPTGYGMVDCISTEEGAQAIIGLAHETGVDWSQSDPDLINQQNRTPAITRFIAAAKFWL